MNVPLPRRRLQFSIRTLLLLITLAIVLLVAWRVYVQPFRHQREVMVLIEKLNGHYETEAGGPGWLRTLFGRKNFQSITFVNLADSDDPDAYINQVASLPHLETLVVGGKNFTDSQLGALKNLETLRGLVLDSTSVTDDKATTLKSAMAELVVYESQRRAIAKIVALHGAVVISEHRTSSSGVSRQVFQPLGDEYFEVATAVQFVGTKVEDAMPYLKRLPTLETLTMQQTKVSDAGLAHLKETSIKQLHLYDTQVTASGLEQLKALPNLQGLSLDACPVNNSGLLHLRHMVGLESLRLDDTQVSDRGLEHLRGLRNLRRLYLAGTKVSDNGLMHLRRLAQLEVLDLERTHVTDAGLVHLTELRTLTDVDLGGTKVGNDGLLNLKALTQLDTLGLLGTNVDDAGLAHLKSLTNLRILDLSRTNVTDLGIEGLRKVLPTCNIWQN